MSDDWKGEALIRANPVNRGSETRRLVSSIWHENRRKAGAPAPAAKKHAQFVKLAVYAGPKT